MNAFTSTDTALEAVQAADEYLAGSVFFGLMYSQLNFLLNSHVEEMERTTPFTDEQLLYVNDARYKAQQQLAWALGHVPESEYPDPAEQVAKFISWKSSDELSWVEEQRIQLLRETLGEGMVSERTAKLMVLEQRQALATVARQNAEQLTKYVASWLTVSPAEGWEPDDRAHLAIARRIVQACQRRRDRIVGNLLKGKGMRYIAENKALIALCEDIEQRTDPLIRHYEQEIDATTESFEYGTGTMH